MPVVVKLSEYRKKGVLTMLRELLVAASRSKIAGIRVEVHWKDGRRQTYVAGNIDEQREECAGGSRPCIHQMR